MATTLIRHSQYDHTLVSTWHRLLFGHSLSQNHLEFRKLNKRTLSNKRIQLSCFAHATMTPIITREKSSDMVLPVHQSYKDGAHNEVLLALEHWSKDEILPFLKPVEKMWQPHDLLPDPTTNDFLDKVHDLREQARALPDEYIVCLVGNTITEEALPTYQSSMYRFLSSSIDDRTSSWAMWARSWTAEENRHGDLLHKYLYLSGKVDMRMIEKTTHYLIQSGMDVGLDNNPYLGFIYTSFQERATFISHGNIARQAKEFGDIELAKICGSIAADEKRHEHAYTKVVQKLFEIDPDGTMLALEEMMRKKIVMPAHLMYDGVDENLFDHFSSVAQRTGVYTSNDYANNLEYFLNKWSVDKIRLTTSKAQAAQDYVCGLLFRIRRLQERAQCKANRSSPKCHQFSWIFNREVML